MRIPLLIKVFFTLRRGWNMMSPEAKQLVGRFVKSQKGVGGYLNAGGKVDDYYTQFGKVLEAVFSLWKLPFVPLTLEVKESLGRDNVYGGFFGFIKDELHFNRPKKLDVEVPERLTTNAVCCILSMKYQMKEKCDAHLVDWLKRRQDESGGFYSCEEAPIPDLLTTAVALFTLNLLGEKTQDVSDFIEAHWMDNGGFAPTILDDYSDVEYVFYGLLALGSK